MSRECFCGSQALDSNLRKHLFEQAMRRTESLSFQSDKCCFSALTMTSASVLLLIETGIGAETDTPLTNVMATKSERACIRRSFMQVTAISGELECGRLEVSGRTL